MISDFDFNQSHLQIYDHHPIIMSHNILSENLNENDYASRLFRQSSQCLRLKKKIRRKQKRPQVLKIEESGRNVKLYSVLPSMNNLEISEQEKTQQQQKY